MDTVTTDTNWTISLTPLGYDHNQLGILRESSSNQGNSNPNPPQSSYARVSLMKFVAFFKVKMILKGSLDLIHHLQIQWKFKLRAGMLA